MATPPWKSNNTRGPSDEELDRVVQAHEKATKEQRQEEVKRLVADPEVYQHRLDQRGYREYECWVKIQGKWVRKRKINPALAASEAVNEGSIAALRTTLPEENEDALRSLPDRPP